MALPGILTKPADLQENESQISNEDEGEDEEKELPPLKKRKVDAYTSAKTLMKGDFEVGGVVSVFETTVVNGKTIINSKRLEFESHSARQRD